jgi:hypothetical protein
MLGKENVKELRQTLAHLSLPAVRDFYQQSYWGTSFTVAFRARAGCRRSFRFGNSYGNGVDFIARQTGISG